MPKDENTPDATAARLENAVDRFEEAWQRCGSPAIDDFLPTDQGDRAALLVELVHVDLEYRLKAGEAVRVEAYLQRYPELSRERRVVLDLLAAEWRFRRRDDPSVALEEYTRRFPELGDALLSSATVSVSQVDSSQPPTVHGGPVGPSGAPPDGVATLSRYRILRLHARGGLGEILAARDEDLHREVALKRLLPRQKQAAESRGRFLREAEITSQLEHPGVVPVYGLGQAADGSPVYAMRLIRGETFQEAVARFHRSHPPERESAPRSLAFRQLLSRFLSVCNTVAYAHSRGVIHRDLKPGNILLGSYGETLVVDWGLAKPTADGEVGRAASAEALAASSSGELTQAGEVFGTPAYMSPEQADGRWDVVGPASDVYSLGATLYVLLTGQPPFGPGAVGEVLEKVRRSVFPRPRQVQKGISRSLEAVCLKAMAARPEQRYGSALALAADLEKWLAGEPVGAWREPVAARARRWMRRHVTLIATAAVTLAAFAVVAVVTALWFASAAREKAAREVADVRQKELDRADLERYFFHVAAADRDWWFARFPESAQHLAECKRPELYGWEWNHLARRSRDSEGLLTLTGHEKEVWNVAYSADGKTLASAGQDGTVRIWDAVDGRQLFKLDDHNGFVYGVAFSPDGAVLATGGDDRTVRLWDVKTGWPLRSFGGLPGAVFSVAFSHDGKLLAAGTAGAGVDRLAMTGAGGEVDLWDYPAWTKHKPIEISTGCATSVAFSPDDKILNVGTMDRTVRRWDVGSAEEQEPLKGPAGPVQSVACSPDGLLIAAASADGRLWLWDAATGGLKQWLYGHGAYTAWGVAFSPDSRRIASSGDDRAVRVWDAALGRLLFSLHGHTKGIANVVFSPDGARLASASDDTTVMIWDARGTRTSRMLCGHKHSVWGVAISPNGRRYASAGAEAADDGPADDAAVRVWGAAGGEEAALHVPDGAHAVAFDPRGRFLAAAAGDGTIRVWDANAGWKEQILRGHAKAALCVAFSPDGLLMASASADGTIKLWDTATWLEKRTLQHGDPVRCVAFSPDGKRLASGGDDRTIKLWTVASGDKEGTLTGRPAPVRSVAFSPDGKRLAAASAAAMKTYTQDAGEIAIWDLDTGQTVLTMRGHIGDVMAVTYSPDGKRLASAGWDAHIKLWEPTTGQEILTLYEGHFDTINALAFSPSGDRLASASSDGAVILWNGAPPDAREK